MNIMTRVLLMGLLFSFQAWAVEPDVQLTLTGEDQGTCLECHGSGKVSAVLNTAHFVATDPYAPASKSACESCHGPSREHTEFPREIANFHFGQDSKNTTEEQNGQCLNCHENQNRTGWHASEHEANDVGCASCHQIHVSQDKVLHESTQAEVCYSCHLEKKSGQLMRSRHPIREGKMSCGSCHNPHGSGGEHELIKLTTNDTCYECHAEKRGPYLYEHAPVVEDCAICHDAHGTPQPAMLVERPPFLCQECHSESFHPAYVPGSSDLPGGGGDYIGKLVSHSCLNCHQRVHGSNHPAGNIFTR